MKKKIVLKLPFTKKQLKSLGVARNGDLNGLYVYNTCTAYINVGSDNFKDTRNENDAIKLLTQVDTHETIHALIHDVLGRYTGSKQEERICLLMANQMDWKTGELLYG